MPHSDALHALARVEPQLPRTHLRALGVAVALTSGVGLFLLTAFHVVFHLHGLPLGLLSHYFYGYDLTWTGAFVGMVWGAATGFVAGWLLGTVHNLTLGVWAFVVRARQDPDQASDLLDNI